MKKGAGEGLDKIWLEDGKRLLPFVKCFLAIQGLYTYNLIKNFKIISLMMKSINISQDNLTCRLQA